MKKLLLLSLLLIISITLLSFDVDLVKSHYKTFINEYEENNREEVLKVFFDEMDNLGLYRFYRNKMIGTAEFSDRPTSIQTYLSRIHQNMKFKSIEEEMAFSAFLVYVQSELSGTRMTLERLRSMPAHFTTVQKYIQEMQEDSLTYLGNVIAYSLGLVEDSPYKDIKKFPMNARLTSPSWYLYLDEPSDVFDELIKENKEEFEKMIEDLSKTRLTGSNLEFEIDGISEHFLTDLNYYANLNIENLRIFFIEESSKKFNFSLLRFLVYLIAGIIVFIFAKKYLKFYIIGLYGLEIIYFLFFFDISRDIISSFVYGSIIVLSVFLFGIITLLRVFSRNKNILQRLSDLFVFLGIVLILILPTYQIIDLTIDKTNEFKNTYFENQLLNDTIIYQHAKVNRHINVLKSLLGTEYSEINSFYSARTSRYIQDNINAGIFDSINIQSNNVRINLNRDGLLYSNVDFHRQSLENYSENIKRILRASKFREGFIENEVKDIKKEIENIFRYSDSDFRKKFNAEFDKFFAASDLLEGYKNDFESFKNDIEYSEKIPLNLYNTGHGTKILVIFFFSLILFIIFENKKFKFVTFIGMLFASFLMFIKPTYLDILSEVRYPIIYSSDYTSSLIVGLIMITLSLTIYFRRGGIRKWKRF